MLLGHAPSRLQSRTAATVAVLAFVAFVVSFPVRHTPLARIDSFIPIVDTALFLGDVMTATLLFTQAAMLRSRGLIALACGYLFTGFLIIPHALTFPDAFAPAGLLGAGVSTTIWLYFFWHTGLPLTVVVYALLKKKDADSAMPQARIKEAILLCVCISVLATILLTLWATRGQAWLPQLMTDKAVWIPSKVNLVACVPLLLSVAAIVILMRSKRSILDLWLMLLLFVWLLETVLVMGSSARFSVGWYTGRIAGLFSGVFVLLLLMSEIARLYMRSALLVTMRHREREGRNLTMNAVAAAMAHEIKQPLASMVAYAGAGVGSTTHQPPNIKHICKLFESIEQEGLRAGGVVDSVRAMFAQRSSTRAPLDMSELLSDTLRLIQDEAQVADVMVVVRLEPRPLRLLGDHVQLKHVLLNLLINAIEAMKSVNNRARLLQIESSCAEGMVQIVVTDSGTGLGETGTERIFEAFYTTKPQGTGMGLALCRSIVEAHGGKIVAMPGRHCGAVFSVSLPEAARQNG